MLIFIKIAGFEGVHEDDALCSDLSHSRMDASAPGCNKMQFTHLLDNLLTTFGTITVSWPASQCWLEISGQGGFLELFSVGLSLEAAGSAIHWCSKQETWCCQKALFYRAVLVSCMACTPQRKISAAVSFAISWHCLRCLCQVSVDHILLVHADSSLPLAPVSPILVHIALCNTKALLVQLRQPQSLCSSLFEWVPSFLHLCILHPSASRILFVSKSIACTFRSYKCFLACQVNAIRLLTECSVPHVVWDFQAAAAVFQPKGEMGAFIARCGSGCRAVCTWRCYCLVWQFYEISCTTAVNYWPSACCCSSADGNDTAAAWV